MFSRLFSLSEKGAKDLKDAIIASVCANLSLMLPVPLLVLVITDLLNPLIGGEEKELKLWIYLLISLALVVVIYLAHLIQYRKTYISAYEESANRRITLAEKIRKLPLSFFGQKDLSELTNTIMGDCTSLEHTFSHAVPQLFGSLISLLLVGMGMLIFDWRMALSLLIALPLSLVVVFGSKKLQNKYSIKNINTKLQASDSIQETLEGMKVIKACNQRELYLSKVDEKLDEVIKTSINSELLTATLVTSAQGILRFGLPIIILTGTYLLSNGEISLVNFLIFLMVASRIYDPLTTVLQQVAELFLAQIQIGRMKDLENQEIMEGEEKVKLENYDIQLRNVTFSYNKENVLDNVSLYAKQGEVTALVGSSGSGKTTIAKLMARFWDVDEGSITVGGKNIKTIEPEELLSNFAIVFQEVVLFNDTLYNNIKIGKKDATKEEVIAAAKEAQCDDFIKRMPSGYDTIIGENGWTLSGGERQRLSIARAVLKDAPIILLDEATAALDVENEGKIQGALTKLIKNKTVIIIAHRMRTVEGASKIVVLDKGKVCEEGSHSTLINRHGLYESLVRHQKESASWQIK